MSVVLDLKVLPPGVIGAEVRGIDLAHVTNTEIDAIKNAWYRHDVLLFRNQQLTDDDLLSFSRHFGTLDSPPNQGAGRKSPPGYPEVYIVSNVLGEQGERGSRLALERVLEHRRCETVDDNEDQLLPDRQSLARVRSPA